MSGPLRERTRRTLAAAGRSRVAFLAWVVLITLLAVSFSFRASAEVGPGTVQARVSPALEGRTELAVPPLGAVRAATHGAPVQLRFELRELDLLGALGPDGRPGIEGIEAEVNDDIGGALMRLGMLLALAAAAAGALAAMAFPGHRSPGRLALGALIGTATAAVLVLPASVGYDPERFERDPELVGPLMSAPELLQRVGSLETRFGSVESRTRVLSERVARLYSAAVTGEIERSEGEVVLLHVSDLHLNAVGLSLAQELARNFDVDAVIDTGDITSFGFQPEAGFVELLEGFEMPYYVVPGNHDSLPVRRLLAESDAVEYLDGDVVEIAGVKVLGIGDPTVTALRQIPPERLDRTYRAQFPLTRRLVRAEQPDLLMVHSPVQARPVIGDVPAVAAGHLHRTRLEILDGSVVAVVGSSGATGLGDLIIDEGAPYRFQLLRFLDGTLVAVDQIELTGADGDFVLNRRVIRKDEGATGDEEIVTTQVREPSLEELGSEQVEMPTSAPLTGRAPPGPGSAPTTAASGGDSGNAGD
jgi:predicted phosphodiesterase